MSIAPTTANVVPPRLDGVSVLVFLGSWWPGNDASGPHQSVFGWCRGLEGEAQFRVLARDRAFDANEPLVTERGWIDRGFAHFSYRNVRAIGVEDARAILAETTYDILALNGLHDPTFTLPALALRRLGRIPRKPVILSPRGELNPGAIDLKPSKKAIYRALLKRGGLLDGVWLLAASESEREDIARVFPLHRRVLTAANIRLLKPMPPRVRSFREGGRLRLAYLSRIDRKKNLDLALRILQRIDLPVDYDIWGPVSDVAYWKECQHLINAMPENVQVRHRGVLNASEIPGALAGCDALFFPTRGENFGHAIFDALEAGLPVIISDRTPLRGLKHARAGYDLPIDGGEGYLRAIREVAALSDDVFESLRRGARAYAEAYLAKSDAVAQTRATFARVLSEKP